MFKYEPARSRLCVIFNALLAFRGFPPVFCPSNLLKTGQTLTFNIDNWSSQIKVSSFSFRKLLKIFKLFLISRNVFMNDVYYSGVHKLKKMIKITNPLWIIMPTSNEKSNFEQRWQAAGGNKAYMTQLIPRVNLITCFANLQICTIIR